MCVCAYVGTCVCVHMGLHARDRHLGPPGVLTRTSILTFRWAIAMEDKIHESEVSVRADNASERGVPIPAAWQNAMRCRDLSSRAEEAGRALEAVDGVSHLLVVSTAREVSLHCVLRRPVA